MINQGKLAVVQGIEVSQLFDCNIYNGQPTCSKEMIDESIDELYGMGVRQMELINKFDNALAGVAGDGGETGVVVNSGNKKETNRYWDMRTCSVGEGDKEQPALPRDVLIGNGLAALLPPGHGAGLSGAAALQLLRAQRPRRVRRPPADEARDHDRPRPPLAGGARRGARDRRGQALPGDHVEPQLVERPGLPAHPRAGRGRHPVRRLDDGLRRPVEEGAPGLQLALLQRVRLRRRHERLRVAGRCRATPRTTRSSTRSSRSTAA